MTNEGLNKRIQEHSPEGLFIFANINRTFHWLDLSSPTSAKVDHDDCAVCVMLIFLQADFLVKILFAKAHVLCHDTNQVTKNVGHLDVVMGTSTGDIIWLEAYTQKYFRINKNAR